MQTPGDPRDNYLARLEWLDDGTLAIQQLNRLQNQQRLAARRRRHRRGARASSATSRRRGSTSSTRCAGSTRAARSCGSASATAGGTSTASPRDGGDGDARSRASTPTSIDVAGVDEASGLALLHRLARRTRRSATSIASRLDGSGTPERVTPARSARHAQLRRRARRPPGVPHLLALRHAAGHRRRRAARRTGRCAR